VERYPVVEDRVRLTAEDLDVVAQISQRPGEMAGVDPLTPDVGLPPVRQVGDAQRLVLARPGGGWGTVRSRHKHASLIALDRSVK
jgi:hypothetical protein